MHAGRARPLVLLAALCVASSLGVAACGSSGSPSASHGTASVACAGSLLKLYEDQLGPAFAKATGDSFGGPPCEGSSAIAQEILADEIDPGVFFSLGTKAIGSLFPSRARFSLSIASDPLVVAYSSSSRYYAELQAVREGRRPLSALFTLLATPGFRLGRTDPTQDPQGAYFILMCKLAEHVLHLRAGEADRILGITAGAPYGSPSQIYDETALPTDISTGIVDAGSEYLPQARQNHLDYITLPPTLDFAAPAQSALYKTVSIPLKGALFTGGVIHIAVTLVRGGDTKLAKGDEAADKAFVAFLLGAAARGILAKAGFQVHAPVLELAPGAGSAAAVLPASVLRRFEALWGVTSS